ncbi:unnamed protein product [Penicillium nalgiovense]|nr:unnamed protein product [Penicillium nalgiovense]
MTEPSQPPVPEEPPNAVLTDSRPTSARDSRDDDREALELHTIQTREDDELDYSTASGSSGDEPRVSTNRITSRADSQRRLEARKGLWGKICRLWNRNVIITVPQKSNRDHFALERTFLAYIRTSTIIAMQGVLVAQLFRLQRPPEKANRHRLSFYEVGIPLSVACHIVAAIVTFIGAVRFFRQQNAIVRGKVHAGGWELNSVGFLLFLVSSSRTMLDLWILIDSQHSGYCGDIDSYCYHLDRNKFEPRSAFDSNIMAMKHRL